MAEFDCADYLCIGADRAIETRSERCFRDYSPDDTIVSLEKPDEVANRSVLQRFLALGLRADSIFITAWKSKRLQKVSRDRL
jgi:hypothetical protein